jgi:hypothetical protein
MTTPNFSALVARHRAYFRTGATRSAQWREPPARPANDRKPFDGARLPPAKLIWVVYTL